MSRILFLHGASSAGKSTLAKAIRAASATPWLHLSLDHYRDSGALTRAHFKGAHHAKAFDGMHRSFAAFAEAGNDLIIEHILDAPGFHPQLQALLSAHALLFIGLHTPLERLNTREAARGDRPMGSAAQDFASVHKALRYDLQLDGTADPAVNAKTVLDTSFPPRSNFFP